MKEITTKSGFKILVDDCDYNYLSLLEWVIIGRLKPYAYTNIGGVNCAMHRIIMSVSDRKIQIDHRNGNTLDNQRGNLRSCTNQQNSFNTKARKGTSIYKGVSFCKTNNKYKVAIKHNGKSIHLGYYKDEVLAAMCYDKKAIELFGEYAYLNFI